MRHLFCFSPLEREPPPGLTKRCSLPCPRPPPFVTPSLKVTCCNANQLNGDLAGHSRHCCSCELQQLLCS